MKIIVAVDFGIEIFCLCLLTILTDIGTTYSSVAYATTLNVGQNSYQALLFGLAYRVLGYCSHLCRNY